MIGTLVDVSFYHHSVTCNGKGDNSVNYMTIIFLSLVIGHGFQLNVSMQVGSNAENSHLIFLHCFQPASVSIPVLKGFQIAFFYI